MDAAWERGITSFDTADAYGGGRSETWIGRWRAATGNEPVLTTKVFHSVEGDPADRGLSRERILRQIDRSLQRLGVERVDMYLIHEPDPDTPIEETLDALEELVQAGKVGEIGASNVDRAWLEQAGPRVAWVQNSHSLLDRESEWVAKASRSARTAGLDGRFSYPNAGCSGRSLDGRPRAPGRWAESLGRETASPARAHEIIERLAGGATEVSLTTPDLVSRSNRKARLIS